METTPALEELRGPEQDSLAGRERGAVATTDEVYPESGHPEKPRWPLSGVTST